jgi:glycosyltransferase involved in cell wall biosynthesis
MPKFSIVVPLHNEQENVTDLYDRLKAVMEANGETFEIVLVDDGSTDRSFHMLREIAAVDSRVTVVKLRRNFGQTSALAAGFDHARGEYIIAMDGDLQHDPTDIPMFLEKIAEGYDIVSGWRKNRIDNLWLRRIPSRCANWLMAKLSGVDIDYFQGLSARDPGPGAAVRRTAPVHSGAGFMARGFHLRSADPECQSRARRIALRYLANLPCLF